MSKADSKPDYSFMKATYETALNFGLPIISTDTSARILSVVYVHGNNEFMVHSPKFQIEIDYIKRRFHIQGTETPTSDITSLIQHYSKELEEYEKQNPKRRYPDWAKLLFKTRYGFDLIN